MNPRLVLLAVAVSCAACSAPPKCTTGDSKACVGPAGCSGGQVCKADGTWGTCDCGSAGGGSGGSAGGGSGGAGGGSGGAGGGAAADAGSGPPCDLLTQTGCTSTQRCTWVASGAGTGAIGCVADGTIDAGAPCVAATLGADGCRRGLGCVQGFCEPFCDATAPACPTDSACTTYSNLLTFDGGLPLAGLCVPGCDPVTQERLPDHAAACGSPNPGSPSMGCYGMPGTAFQCAPAGPASNVSDVAITGTVYLNSCAPGFQGLLEQVTGSSTPICSAFCLPAPTSSSNTTNATGAPGSGYTCPDRGAAGFHECRYLGFLETPPVDAAGRTMGFCLDWTRYTYDATATGGSPTQPMPSCKLVSATAHTFDPTITDAQWWGCMPLP